MKDVCEKIFERSLLPCFQCLLHAITVCTDLLVHHLASGISGAKLSCVLATMANRSKEDSELDPIEDELEFIRAMKQAGFDVHVPWQMGLLVPGGEPLTVTFLANVLDFLKLFEPTTFASLVAFGALAMSSVSNEVFPSIPMGLLHAWPADVLGCKGGR